VTDGFTPPIDVTIVDGERAWELRIGDDERALISRLLGELRTLLTSDDDSVAGSPLLQRLFPTVYTDDPEKEAEYQRLMREELVTSRVHQIDVVAALLGTDESMSEATVVAFMQSLNAVRIVLGTVLDVGEDDELDEIDDDDEFAGEHHLYGYLSWLLEWTVRSLHT